MAYANDANWWTDEAETNNHADFMPLVLSGDALSYSYAREFARVYGTTTTVLATADIKYTSKSRFTRYHVIDDLDQEDVMMSVLRDIAADTPIGAKPWLLLAGASDWNVRTLSRHKEELEKLGFVVPYIDFPLLDDVTQKDRFYAMCARLGVPFPKTVVIPFSPSYEFPDMPARCNDMTCLESDNVDAKAFTYPLIAKPSNSADWHYARINDKHKVYSIENPQQLDTLIDAVKESGYSHALLLQEMLSTSDDSLRTITTFSDEGEVAVGVLGHVAIQDRSSTGIGNPLAIYGDGHNHDGLLEMAAKLVSEMHYDGYANFDVMYGKDGKPRFLEVNTRPGRNSYYVSLAGCPFVKPIVEHNVHHRATRDSLTGFEACADKRFLFTMVPRHVAAKEVHGLLREEVLKMYANDKWANPLMNDDDCLSQRFWGYVNFEHMKTKFA